MSFVRNGCAIKWLVSSSPGTADPSMAFATADVLEELI
jgi:hypothetical protein